MESGIEPSQIRFRDVLHAPGEVLQLTVTELQLLLEGCALVGKIALSPGEFVLKSA